MLEVILKVILKREGRKPTLTLRLSITLVFKFRGESLLDRNGSLRSKTSVNGSISFLRSQVGSLLWIIPITSLVSLSRVKSFFLFQSEEAGDDVRVIHRELLLEVF